MYLYVLFGYWYVFVHVLVRISMFFGMNCFMLVATIPKTSIRANTCQTHIQPQNTSKYIPKYGQIRTQYIPIPPLLAGNPCAKMVLNTYQNIPNTYQFVQIHTKIHTNTGSFQHPGRRFSGGIGMYCVRICPYFGMY